MAASCAGAGGQSAMLPASASMAGARSSGMTIHPRRHPVIPQYLLKELMTTALSSISAAHTPRGSGSSGAGYVTPW